MGMSYTPSLTVWLYDYYGSLVTVLFGMLWFAVQSTTNGAGEIVVVS